MVNQYSLCSHNLKKNMAMFMLVFKVMFMFDVVKQNCFANMYIYLVCN